MNQFFSNTCIEYDGEPSYYGSGIRGNYSKPYKSFRVYRTNEPNAVVDETNIEERNEEYRSEFDTDLWCVDCESREMAIILCGFLNLGIGDVRSSVLCLMDAVERGLINGEEISTAHGVAIQNALSELKRVVPDDKD